MDRGRIEIPADQLRDVRKISIRIDPPNIHLRVWFHSSRRVANILYNQNDFLVVAPGNPIIVREEGLEYVMGRHLQQYLRRQARFLQSVSINIVRGTTLSLQFGVFHALIDALKTMNRNCKIFNLKIDGAMEFQLFPLIQRMLKYKSDAMGTVTLRFQNELDPETRRRASSEMLKIRSLVLEVSDVDDITTDLPYTDSTVLKILKLTRHPKEGEPTNIDLIGVIALDQWRNADEVTVNTFVITTPLQQLQLENKIEVDLLVNSLSIQDMDYLKQQFFNNPRHKQFKIKYRLLTDYNQDDWERYEGNAHFEIPDTLDVLSVVHDDNEFTFTRFVNVRDPLDIE